MTSSSVFVSKLDSELVPDFVSELVPVFGSVLLVSILVSELAPGFVSELVPVLDSVLLVSVLVSELVPDFISDLVLLVSVFVPVASSLLGDAFGVNKTEEESNKLPSGFLQSLVFVGSALSLPENEKNTKI